MTENSESRSRYISIVASSPPKEVERHGMFPNIDNISNRVNKVAVDTLRSNISTTISALHEIADSLPDSSNFMTDSLVFNLSVNGQGKISLIGEISAGTQSSITITLKRKNNNEQV